MARSRTRRGGGWADSLPLPQRLAVKGAKAYGKYVLLPTAKFAAKQVTSRTGVMNTPEAQMAMEMYKGAKSAYQSPQGQALMNQALQAATSPQAQAMRQQAYTGLKAAATSPQARQAFEQATGLTVPSQIPMATPVPTAAPAAPAAPASSTLSLTEQAITNRFLMFHQRGKPNETDASYIADIAKQINNKPRNNALLAGIGALATDVKALHDAGTPQTVPFETAMSRTRGFPSLNAFELYETLSDPATRSRIARELVSAQDPPNQPNSRRFLAGVINQFAVAIRNAMQKKLLLGGKTRRGRKARRTTRRR